MSQDPNSDTRSIGERIDAGESVCRLHLRVVGEISGGLWSWRVYVDGNVHGRGPGSTRKDPLPWYASLLAGPHRVVLRKGEGAAPVESNTLEFVVDGQSVIVVEVQESAAGVVAICLADAGAGS